ncbi:hypothetical protein [Moraxella sp. ZY210820]|uniref:hypothetical protein n=1 Tax=unclassified Moraxella TaxID=2685852 RepID=UPI0027313289|nr:hypothetical protein [Moraxella sp. ZY210820]WLF84517.1 hypothetical protein LU301_03305 [Moraxella sp. ZY210820]
MTDIKNSPNAIADYTNVEMYMNMIKDSINKNINLEQPNHAEKIVISYIEGELAKLIRYINNN